MRAPRPHVLKYVFAVQFIASGFYLPAKTHSNARLTYHRLSFSPACLASACHRSHGPPFAGPEPRPSSCSFPVRCPHCLHEKFEEAVGHHHGDDRDGGGGDDDGEGYAQTVSIKPGSGTQAE